MDDDDESLISKLRQRMTNMMRTNGHTEYEVEIRAQALEFLFVSFLRAGKNHWLAKQTEYLAHTGGLTEADWIDYLDLNWKYSGLYNDEEKEDIN